MAASDCPPLDVRITRSLLGYGVIAGPIYVVVATAQAVTREGFDPTRHTVSQLENGALGWIQIANFLVTGAMTIAAAVGIGRALPFRRTARWSAVLLTGYGAGLIAAGALRADSSDGFPPGTPAGMGTMSWHGIGHLAAATVGFACFVAACFTVAAALSRMGLPVWARVSRVVAVVFAASFVYLSSGTGGAAPILIFTVAVVLSWAWLTAVSLKLYGVAGGEQADPQRVDLEGELRSGR